MANKNNTGENTVLTRGTKKLIAKAIEETGDLNSSILCEHICEELCSKFTGDSLDYQLNRMNITTTKSIIDAIDVYIYRHSKNNEISVGAKSNEH